MTFKKNDSRINRAGRPKGSKSKSVEDLRKLVQYFINANIKTLQNDFDQLEPASRLNFIERLLKHVLPRPMHELERLTDEQLDELIERLKNEQ